MNETEASRALLGILNDLSVSNGDTIYLAIDMANIPLPRIHYPLSVQALKEMKQRWCQFVFEQIMKVIGPEGTLLVGAFTYACGNIRVPFVLEESPSELGPFTEWLRKKEGSIRSIHPIFSVVGFGPKAGQVLTNNGPAGFGPCSPFGRLRDVNAKFVTLGVPFHLSITYLHHLEQCFGCNHRYNKVIKTPVFQGGAEVKMLFLSYLRWYGLDACRDFRACETRLLDSGLMNSRYWEGCINHAVRVSDVDQIGYQMLSENPCAFLSKNLSVELLSSVSESDEDAVDPIKVLEVGF